MQHETNAEFISAIERELEGVKFFSVGACPGCAGCGLDHITDEIDDPDAMECASEGDAFSTHDCDSCGSSLAGSRTPAHGYVPMADTDAIFVHFDICVDCAMYHANGDMPFDDDTVE